MIVLGGCATSSRHAALPMPVRGYANLDVLVRRHPGWAGVARYDAALVRLDEAAHRQTPIPPATGDLVSLPPAEAGPVPTPVVPLDGPRRRLEQVERVQVARLRARQAENRQRQLDRSRVVWERQAATQYAQDVKAARSEYAQRLDGLASDRDARRLNLTLQIRALQKIVTGWNASLPPTPELNQARADLSQKKTLLATLGQVHGEAVAQAMRVRDGAIAQAERTRVDFVSSQASLEEARLQTQDTRQVVSLQDRLAVQRVALLHEMQTPPAAPVPATGALGPQSLQPGPALVTLTPGMARSLRASRTRLSEQRTRWLAYLYDDTRAAALDTASRHRWLVTFGPPARGDKDLTAPLAQALTTQVWKT